ncbi:MAG: kdpD, partial [Deltaproteobacteria bacterium]|nr:kdpD [Deltaproteobacteria bacterium]
PVSISVSVREKEVITAITDAAPPIPAAEREHVFDKFYRQNSLKHISGAGLGLSICKGIIEAHGGHIWIESSPEYGNRFSFSLAISEELLQKDNSEKGADNVG